MRIRVCDDVEVNIGEWVAEIKGAVPGDFDVARMEDAKDKVSDLLQRKFAVEKGRCPLEHPTEFDDIDVLVVDYDLLHLDDDGGRTTGEGIARLARSYSNCGAIVVMNQFTGPQFDLGMRGHLDSYADINIDADLVGQKALWADLTTVDQQFDPTTWTPLPALLAAARELRDKMAEAGPETKLMSLLGLELGALAEMSDTAYGFLSITAQTDQDLADLKVRDFLDRALDTDTVECLLKTAPALAYNFAAFRIIKWLERAVLRPMNVLVDAAHLIDRLPFVIDSSRTDVANPAAWIEAAAKPDEKLYWDLLKPYLNDLASGVLGRPIFDWFRLANDDKIDELQDAYLETQAPRFYLAEDTSRFVSKDALTRYRADFHNFGDRRAIEYLDKFAYGPLRRIRFG